MITKCTSRVKMLATVILLITTIISGCQRNSDFPDGDNPVVIVDDNITVTAGIRGIIIDENNQPVQGATVSSGTNTVTTDRYGIFQFTNINLSKENGHIKTEKAGYFTAHRTFPSTAGRMHTVRIKLLPKVITGNFNAAAGGTVTLSSGGKVILPANGITDASGNAYSGQVNIAMTWIDPTSPNLADVMMGDLRGINTAGEERGLQTFGMLGVEMTNPAGQPLKIATGKKAELIFPIPSSIAATAPATIDLWHYDEVKGRWIQEGTAIKTGTNYVTQVSHFSFWNCDVPFPLINLCMQLINTTNGQPLNNVSVRVKRPNGSYGYGRTDSSGRLCGKVPKNEALLLEVLDQCNSVVFSQNIGPFAADADLGTVSITIAATNILTITGTVKNCSNANVTNGAVIVYTGGGYAYSAPVTNGTFSVSILRCSSGSLTCSVVAVDYSTLQQSIPVSVSGTSGVLNAGTLQACGTSSAQFIEYIIDGGPHTFASPMDSIFMYNNPGGNNWTFYGSKNPATTDSILFTAITVNYVNSPGTYTMLPGNVTIQTRNNIQYSQIVSPNPVINITNLGSPGGYMECNFNVQMNFGGTIRNVKCNFRGRRS